MNEHNFTELLTVYHAVRNDIYEKLKIVTWLAVLPDQLEHVSVSVHVRSLKWPDVLPGGKVER